MDASLVSAPRQRASAGEKAAIKAGQAAGELWERKAKLRPDGAEQAGIAIPVFGCKSHTGIDRKHGIIRRQIVTDAAAHDGARLREGLVDAANTGSGVWADTAYRSKRNEDWLKANGMTSRIHRRKPRSRPMSERTAKPTGANRRSGRRWSTLAHQKDRMGLRIRTAGWPAPRPSWSCSLPGRLSNPDLHAAAADPRSRPKREIRPLSEVST